MPSDVEITGHLELTLEDEATIDVTAYGSRVRCEIGDLASRRPTLRLVGSTAVLAKRLARLLDASALTLTLTRNGKPFADLGSGVRGGPLASILGFSRIRVYWKK